MSKAKEWGGYDVQYNRHGVPFVAGPRTSGAHTDVWDHWATTPVSRSFPGPATCRCNTCGAEWPEGGERPEECVPA